MNASAWALRLDIARLQSLHRISPSWLAATYEKLLNANPQCPRSACIGSANLAWILPASALPLWHWSCPDIVKQATAACMPTRPFKESCGDRVQTMSRDASPTDLAGHSFLSSHGFELSIYYLARPLQRHKTICISQVTPQDTRARQCSTFQKNSLSVTIPTAQAQSS
jgi:hypothetical protein